MGNKKKAFMRRSFEREMREGKRYNKKKDQPVGMGFNNKVMKKKRGKIK